ncbi:fumarylacetoacetate hydrolase (plasmid) [Azospirillum sp. B510]|uniref:fumarylacetoacetate hydrolase family protein n=1 Tax=Azospirillum sp. (strain B510) TaxID=137722 RepID=UPI0001C4C880|nr:fumarylacetoacetate hydrolase family protein [Azospirillum sp. B510]BAI75667.1 fumarylacetoacetate hydrolase [Azospirillum sp. B510]
MKLATLKNGAPDGRLVVVSRDLTRAVDAAAIAPTMRAALDHWERCEADLRALAQRLEEGSAAGAFPFEPKTAMAPLPRTCQFVDASAFLNHGNIMERAYNLTVRKQEGVPILIQRQGDDFRGPRDDYPMLDEDEQGDFEGEFAVITGDLPMGSSPAQAEGAIRLVTLFNDMSMRRHLFAEMQLGFGFIKAKPATVFAPVAVTPDELGEAWTDGRIALDLRIHRNGAWFGHPNGREMDWSFGELLAHLAYNRDLRAGTILGSGTVSNLDAATVGSACLAERRALEVIAKGEATSPTLRFGDRLRFEVVDAAGQSLFGAIDHAIVPARLPAAVNR